jgi:predicted RecB family nuclease
MAITPDILLAYLKCETKGYLKTLAEAPSTTSAFVDWRNRTCASYNELARQHLIAGLKEDQFYVGAPSRQVLRSQAYRLIVDCWIKNANIETCIPAIEVSLETQNFAHRSAYLPVRFTPNEKTSPEDKLLLAFDSIALYPAFGELPSRGKIIHGHQFSGTVVSIEKPIEIVRSLVAKIAKQQRDLRPPPLVLNRHCSECEFQTRCRALSHEKDDLSLLSSFTAKERTQQHEKGIFTVTQLSYTFRPRRRITSPRAKSNPALRAMAIRKNKIHVIGTPVMNLLGTPVYFDVEGIPDRDFYYLIGLRYRSEGGEYVHHSFWANDPAEERTMWERCLRKLASIEKPQLIHYGKYEAQFLKRMIDRYSNDLDHPENVDQLLITALNLVSVIHSSVYFPTYSNGLKEVANYLGFKWFQPAMSGLLSIMWRAEWESSLDPKLKNQLLAYNADDCEAAQKVSDILNQICQSRGVNVVQVDALKCEYPQRFGATKFVVPEFEQINSAAYWDYQRNKVYVRCGPRLKIVSKGNESRLAKVLPINKIINTEEKRPDCCPRCTAKPIYRYGKLSSVQYDIRFGGASVKRWVVKYNFHRFICWSCRNAFQQNYAKPKYGPGLQAYLVYQFIELRMSQRAAAQNLNELFGFSIGRGVVNQIKTNAAKYYEKTYQRILAKISAGQLVHADETAISIGGVTSYVWVFTSLEEVAYVYGKTREAAVAQDFLKDFRGVLVSDFYAGYDSIKCEQQKSCAPHPGY